MFSLEWRTILVDALVSAIVAYPITKAFDAMWSGSEQKKSVGNRSFVYVPDYKIDYVPDYTATYIPDYVNETPKRLK
ncbi:MAG: hypothetical protein K8F62_18555 [Pseudorhodoplanes sp.]|nr:hypothetical protein [Pseudorhodoplanes sp.]